MLLFVLFLVATSRLRVGDEEKDGEKKTWHFPLILVVVVVVVMAHNSSSSSVIWSLIFLLESVPVMI